MKLLDSNILIYAPQPDYSYLLPLLVDRQCFVSEISRLEVLGFHRLTVIEKEYFERVFKQKEVLPITSDIVDLAIGYRQTKKMSLGDAICAATAVIYDLELLTRNVADFEHISMLRLQNPIR